MTVISENKSIFGITGKWTTSRMIHDCKKEDLFSFKSTRLFELIELLLGLLGRIELLKPLLLLEMLELLESVTGKVGTKDWFLSEMESLDVPEPMS